MKQVQITQINHNQVHLLQVIGKQTFHETFAEVNSEENMKTYLEKEFAIETTQIHVDLAQENATEEILAEINKVNCRLLIYNAAYSLIKPFLEHSCSELDNFIAINTKTQIKLVHAFAH